MKLLRLKTKGSTYTLFHDKFIVVNLSKGKLVNDRMAINVTSSVFYFNPIKEIKRRIEMSHEKWAMKQLKKANRKCINCGEIPFKYE